MKTPFPGMDPYLEHPALWPDVHNRLIAAIADAIAPVVPPLSPADSDWAATLDYPPPP